jgi:hypothetical protein
MTFESEHLLHQKESMLQRTIKRIHIIKQHMLGKKLRKKNLIGHIQKAFIP